MATSLKPEQECGLAANDDEVRPQLLALNADGIPDELKDNPRWAPFKAPWNAGRKKFDKIPMSPSRPQIGLSTSQPDQWVSFDEALACYEANSNALSGVGYLMTGPHGIVGYDLDGCVKGGVIDSWALEIAKALSSHTEISLSGKGLRIFCRGKLSEDWVNHSVGLEAYGGNSSRFLTVTGHIVEGFPFDLAEPAQSVHEEIASKYRKVKQKLEVVALPVPDLIDGVRVPDGLPPKAERFLYEGECDGDRSEIVAYCAICLLESGMTEEEALSALTNNPYAMGVALEHRKQDQERAIEWLWRHQVVKASERVASNRHCDFEDYSITDQPKDQLPAFKRDKSGAIRGTIGNISLAVGCPSFVGLVIRFDDFTGAINLSRDGGLNWEPLTDHVYTSLRIDMENRGFISVGKENIRDAIENVALDNRIDTAIHWLNNVIPPWDGTARIESFHSVYLGASDTEYTRSVSMYLWTAMAGRVLDPGLKADMALIWVGRQGIRKTSACKALVPSESLFTEIDIDERRESDNSRKMRGVLVAELAELKGLQTRDAEYVKAFISRTDEEWIPKFKEHPIKVPRRLVFIGTTNSPEFLNDEEDRRWLPVDVGLCDVDAITRDRDQLWAEAREMFKSDGLAFAKAEELAKEVHRDYRVQDPWMEQISRWLDTPNAFSEANEKPKDRDYITSDDVMSRALMMDYSRFNSGYERRVGRVLRQLGYERKTERINGKPKKIWFLPPHAVTDVTDLY